MNPPTSKPHYPDRSASTGLTLFDMESLPHDSFNNLEKLRQNLEANISNLQRSLQYWQTWEAEHEGFKEELQKLPDGSSLEGMLAAGLDMGGDIVNEQEIKGLIGYGRGNHRTISQVISSINGRIDTGQKNAVTVHKQLSTAEEKLSRVLFVSQPTAENEEGQPIMDIMEELDEEGNVISSSIRNDNKATENLDTDLKKLLGSSKNNTKSNTVQKPLLEPGTASNPAQETKFKQTKSKPLEKSVQDSLKPLSTSKKVSFADEPEVSIIRDATSNIHKTPHGLTSGPSKTRNAHQHPTERLLVLDENDNIIDSKPLETVVSSIDEEIAHNREARQGADGIGAIVATLDVDEGETDSEWEGEGDTDDEDLDWNDLGRNNISDELTDDYRLQMQALMEKHAAAFENLGPERNNSVLETLAVATPSIDSSVLSLPVTANTSKGGPDKAQTGNKGVRFAEDLDISSAPKPPSTPKGTPALKRQELPAATAVSDAVIERASPSTRTLPENKPSGRVSKFKTSLKSSGTPDTNSNTTVDSIVERDIVPASTSNSVPKEDVPPKKVSRFKASRLGGSNAP